MRAVLTFLVIVLLLVVGAGFAYYLFDNQQQKATQTIRNYSVENADKKVKLVAVQLDNRLTIAQKNIEPLVQFLSRNDIFNNDFIYKLRETIEDRNAGLTSIGFAFNALYLKRAPYYFWSGDSLHFKDLASEDYWEQDWYKSDSAQWTSDDGIVFFYSKRLKNHEGLLKGILKAQVSFDDSFKENDSETEMVYLIDNQHNRIFSFENTQDISDKILEKESNSQAYIDGEESFYIAFAPVSAVDWTVAVLIQDEEITTFSIVDFVHEHRKILIISVIAFVFVMLFLAFFISRKNGNNSNYRRIQNRMSAVGRWGR